MTVQETIQKQLSDNQTVLYMKGTPAFPQCGFSGRAVQILQECKIDFFAVNVLENEEIREGIKAFGSWPTIPQLYHKSKLVGGSDIMTELYEQGELQQMLMV